jgi:PAS domain S-box-containing protein
MTEYANVFSRPDNDPESVSDDLSEARIRESEQRFRTTFENAAVGIAHVAPNGQWLMVNRRYCEIIGYSAEELAGKTFKDITHPDDMAADLAQRQRVLSGAISNFSIEKRYMRKDGSPIWINLTVGSARKADGTLDYFITVVEDITRRKEAEEERRRVEAKLRESEADLQLAQEAANLGRWSWDLRMQELTWSDRCKALFGLPLDAPVNYETFLGVIHLDDRERIDVAVSQAIRQGRDYDVEMRSIWPDGTLHWIASKGRVYFDGGEPYRMVGVAFDITARKQAEEQMTYALREVDHRSKNLLSVVQAIVRQTARTETREEFVELFSERLRGLAASQDLLVGNKWKGVALFDLIRSQLSHFKDALGSRVKLAGPEIELNASAAQTIGMAVHELATNACKYGALSNETGYVLLAWSLKGEESAIFSIRWSEHEGPAVAKPGRKGFGQTVLLRMAEDALDAEVRLDYDPDGLQWRLQCPAESILKA